MFGGGAQFARGRWRLTAVQGAPERNRPGTGYGALVLESRQKTRSWALAGVRGQGGLGGVSFSGLTRGRGHRLGWEVSGRQDSYGLPWALAWLISGRWATAGRLRLEFQVAGSTSEEGPWTGRRPSVLRTWSGQGWAIRGQGPLGPNMSVALLWARSAGNRRESQGRRYARDMGEALFRFRPASGWSVVLRMRDRRDRKWAWSRDHPWLPAELVTEAPQRGLLIQVERHIGRNRWRLAWRRLERGQGASRVGRSLLEWKGRRLLGRGIKFGWHQMWAWGQDVDLVTAITPVPGMVRPRHWGGWAAETVLNLVWERAGGGLILATGLSRRLACGDTGGGAEYAAWWHGRIFW
ncbi:hypothetical protein CSB20_06895 [bacterium DOLZORAL124_64_63]|nr:MAG: hypothetical protein CSB20_06895 [bacterium DOLZORAL124_64_63]